ncbi:MAG: phenylalanine--tRNA ligase subunit alpha [Legionellales bacterium]|nr:phenylalanine--tRNA ligase subunit alpha [Legionellales bacterium]
MIVDQVNDTVSRIAGLTSIDELEQLRIHWLGKKGQLTQALKSLASLPIEEKKEQGNRLNQYKQLLIEAIEHKRQELDQRQLDAILHQQKVDVTRPPRHALTGSQHPIHHVSERLIKWFSEHGFEYVLGPEVETEYYNFTALNFPDDHPSRQMHDTFYVEGDRLLRTHTSSVQIRCMHNRQPPFSLITAGKTFRVDSDRTHLPMFHQLEGMLVSESTSYSQLKGLLSGFLKYLFGSDVEVRFRPSYFPFTEPSAEVDIKSHDGQWLEVLGCGMIHPNVLTEANIDPVKFRGFAFGAGLDRLAMLLHGVSDIRSFVSGDIGFLEQFK